MNWLLKHFFPYFFFLGVNFFAAGAVAELGGGEPTAESAEVVDPESTETPETVDTPTEDVDSKETTDVDQAAKPEDLTYDARTVPAEVRTHLAELRAAGKGPVADKIANSFAKNALWYREFPNGVKDARDLKQSVADLGGPEGLKDFQTEKNEWRQLDEHFIKGDPALVAGLVRTNPEGFVKMAANALPKWAEVDSASYDHALSGVFVATMQGAGVINDLYLAKQMIAIGKPEEAAKMIEKIEAWAGNLDKLSKTAPKPKAAEPTAPANDHEQRETALFGREVASEVNPNTDTLMTKELKAISAGKDVPEGQRAAFKREVMAATRQLADKDETFRSNFQRYEAARDKTGLIKLVNGKYAEVMNAAVKSVFNRWYRTTTLGGAKKPAPNGAKPAVAGAVRPVEGWNEVSVRPNPMDINRSRGGTSDEMILRGAKGMPHQAILKSGRKVWWK